MPSTQAAENSLIKMNSQYKIIKYTQESILPKESTGITHSRFRLLRISDTRTVIKKLIIYSFI